MSLLQFLSILRARWSAAALILVASVTTALAWSVLRPASYLAQAPVLVDLRNVYDPAEVRAKGFSYVSVGRP